MPRKKHFATDAISPYPPCIHFSGTWSPTSPRVVQKYDAYVTKLLSRCPGKNISDAYFKDGISGQIQIFVEKRCPKCEQNAADEAREARAQAAKTGLASSKSESCQVWGRFFQAETYWAFAYKRYDPDYDDPPSADVLIEWTLEYPQGRLVAYGDACAAFLKWLQKTQGMEPEEGIARYMPGLELQVKDIIDAWDPWEVSYVLPFSPKCCPASLMCLFEKKIGWVYIATMEGNTWLKIGHCLTTPRKRLDQLQVGNPHRLSLLKAFPCAQYMAPKLEEFMHRLLQEKRVRKTEWFAIDLATAEKAYQVAVQQRGDKRYFWTAAQWEKHDEAEEERLGEYYEQYPWEDPEYEWPD
jgi:Meiotically up-regulated gene 113